MLWSVIIEWNWTSYEEVWNMDTFYECEYEMNSFNFLSFKEPWTI